MKRNPLLPAVIVLIMVFSLMLSACASTPAKQAASVRIAVLPILDALPMFVAQKEGLFESKGIKVELIPVASAPERDQVISAGQADGMINEIVSTILYNKDQIQVQIVRFARTATADSAMYRILASAKSNIQSVDDLKGVPIGISQGTVIEYITDRLLRSKGLTADEIKNIAVPKIADRMALLGTGELKAGTLPEPLSSLAVQQGARVILDDTQFPDYAYSTIAFRKPFIDQHADAVRAFLAAIEEATARINADPAKYNDLLSEQKLVPQPLLGSFQVPEFVTASIPTQAQWEDVMLWIQEKGLVTKEVSFQDSVTADYLPK